MTKYAAAIASLKAELASINNAMNEGYWHSTEAAAVRRIEQIKAQIAELEGGGLPETITAKLAASTSGFCAVIDGVMNPMTLATTRNEAARRALSIVTKAIVMPCCFDPDCESNITVLAEHYPAVKIVPVDVTERKA